MVAYNFKARFVPPILVGIKAPTTRAERSGRSRHARAGEAVQLYTGLRTRLVRKLGEPQCLTVDPIRIELPRARCVPEILVCYRGGDIKLHYRTAKELEYFARADGFEDFDDLHAVWAAEHPGVDTFHGVLIRWRPLMAADALDLAGAT